ncbi:carbohydrate ABC transporter permease [Senegalia massiliensis]|jgi:N-acetylglucosamine transport system permease protein|uniref:carbohydrate ABC transporter permease n=1 Tax=Senegalia massiliensis TaxID=1720316 RepID=UPI001030CFF6|nr:carbohydrate ABC transporter permease [Senegalia massiliensis]
MGKLYKAFIYVALISLAASIIIPVGWVFMASVKENSEFYGNPWSLPEGFHFENFIEAIQQANMGEYFLNSVIATSLGLVILLAVSLPAAYVLARFEFRGKKFINRLLMAGLFVNVNYIVVPIFLMLLDWDKSLMNIMGEGFFLDNIVVLALVYASTAIPFTVYLLSNFFKTLPKAFEEAAFIDGAGYFATMAKVMIPMARPSIITVILFNFLAFWNEYIIALTLMPNSSKTLPVGLINLMQSQKAAANYGQLYAGLVIVMLPTLILYILVQKKLTQGMTVGGVKG